MASACGQESATGKSGLHPSAAGLSHILQCSLRFWIHDLELRFRIIPDTHPKPSKALLCNPMKPFRFELSKRLQFKYGTVETRGGSIGRVKGFLAFGFLGVSGVLGSGSRVCMGLGFRGV